MAMKKKAVKKAAKKAAAAKKPLTEVGRMKLMKPIAKAMIDGHRAGLNTVDFIDAFLGTMSVISPDTKFRVRVT